jgi:hypothetical protein
LNYFERHIAPNTQNRLNGFERVEAKVEQRGFGIPEEEHKFHGGTDQRMVQRIRGQFF